MSGNQNGLFSSRDVAATGAVDSNFFLRKGQPIAIPSPLQIISPDGLKTGSIGVGNDSTLAIINNNNGATQGGIFLECAISTQSDVIVVSHPATEAAGGIIVNNMAGAGYDEAASYYCDLDGAALVSSSMGAVRLGNSSFANPVVEVVGSAGTGQVYDTVYKPVNKIITLVQQTSGPIVQNLPYTLETGTYRLELFCEGNITVPVGTRLRMALEDTTPGDAGVVDYSQASISASAAVGTDGFTLNSGSFFVNAGSNYAFIVQSSSTTADWVADTWGLQIVKLA